MPHMELEDKCTIFNSVLLHLTFFYNYDPRYNLTTSHDNTNTAIKKESIVIKKHCFSAMQCILRHKLVTKCFVGTCCHLIDTAQQLDLKSAVLRKQSIWKAYSVPVPQAQLLSKALSKRSCLNPR